jgi:hypothetical protein
MKAHNAAPVVFECVKLASPGYAVLGVLSGDHGEPVEAIKYPVIAWAFEEISLAPYPITLEGVQLDSLSILQPDGSVEQPCIGGFANIDEWFENQQAEHNATKAAK